MIAAEHGALFARRERGPALRIAEAARIVDLRFVHTASEVRVRKRWVRVIADAAGDEDGTCRELDGTTVDTLFAGSAALPGRRGGKRLALDVADERQRAVGEQNARRVVRRHEWQQHRGRRAAEVVEGAVPVPWRTERRGNPGAREGIEEAIAVAEAGGVAEQRTVGQQMETRIAVGVDAARRGASRGRERPVVGRRRVVLGRVVVMPAFERVADVWVSADGPHLTAVQRDQGWIPAAAADARASRLEFQVLHLHELLLPRQVDIGDPFTAVVMAVRFARWQRFDCQGLPATRRCRRRPEAGRQPETPARRRRGSATAGSAGLVTPSGSNRIDAGMRGPGGRALPVAEDQQLALLGGGQQRCMDSDNVSVGNSNGPGHATSRLRVSEVPRCPRFLGSLVARFEQRNRGISKLETATFELRNFGTLELRNFETSPSGGGQL